VIEYCLYGLTVFSEIRLFDKPVKNTGVSPGLPLPVELRPLSGDVLQPQLDDKNSLYSTHGRALWLCTDRPFGRSSQGQSWRLEVEGLVDFLWVGGESQVYYRFQGEPDKALLAFWFVHIFLPLFLTLERGYDFIHGSAVEISGQPILFLAPSMGGKSTLGAYFLQQGHAMLSDDKVATCLHHGRFYGVPSHPHHRPFREREVLGYPVGNFFTRAAPIQAIYLLERGQPDSNTTICEVEGFRKFERLLPHYLFSFRFLQQQRLHWLAQLADRSLVFEVTRPWKMDAMEQVYRAICDHSHTLNV